MVGKADFTDAEWQTLEQGVTGAGLLVALADPGFFDSFKEMGAMAGHLATASRESTSQLVRELARSRAKGPGLGTKPEQIETGTLAALQSALAILQAKAPDETAAYTDLVLDIAQSVANAVSGVVPAESAAVDKIKGVLKPA
jgi:hypothetical protein